MKVDKMIELALKRAVELEMAGEIEKANHFLQLALSAEERRRREKQEG